MIGWHRPLLLPAWIPGCNYGMNSAGLGLLPASLKESITVRFSRFSLCHQSSSCPLRTCVDLLLALSWHTLALETSSTLREFSQHSWSGAFQIRLQIRIIQCAFRKHSLSWWLFPGVGYGSLCFWQASQEIQVLHSRFENTRQLCLFMICFFC